MATPDCNYSQPITCQLGSLGSHEIIGTAAVTIMTRIKMTTTLPGPRCPFHSYHRDGAMRTDGNLGATKSYHPNTEGLWANQSDFSEPPRPVDGEGAHWDYRIDDDHWEQPGNLFRIMSPAQQQLLFDNTARAMGDAATHIKQRHAQNCARADPAYGAGIADALGQPSLAQAAE